MFLLGLAQRLTAQLNARDLKSQPWENAFSVLGGSCNLYPWLTAVQPVAQLREYGEGLLRAVGVHDAQVSLGLEENDGVPFFPESAALQCILRSAATFLCPSI